MCFFVLTITDGVRNYVTLLDWENRHNGHEPVALLKSTIREVQRKVRDPPLRWLAISLEHGIFGWHCSSHLWTEQNIVFFKDTHVSVRGKLQINERREDKAHFIRFLIYIPAVENVSSVRIKDTPLFEFSSFRSIQRTSSNTRTNSSLMCHPRLNVRAWACLACVPETH